MTWDLLGLTALSMGYDIPQYSEQESHHYHIYKVEIVGIFICVCLPKAPEWMYRFSPN